MQVENMWKICNTHPVINDLFELQYIRRPLPSFGLGGAAPGITVGVLHGPVPALCFSMAP